VTREEAIKKLCECPTCHRWITTPSCDGCFVDRMPPSPAEAVALLNRARELGREAEVVRGKLRSLLS
jgi:hypothetical protein